MKFIHFADAHLDSPFRGLSFLPSEDFKQIYQASDISLTKIVDLALKKQVDLVLIAGDTFDNHRPSPRSQVFFAKQIKRLTEQRIQVVMIFGNHDHMPEEQLLVEKSPYFTLLGSGEVVERQTFTTRSGFKYDVAGFSYLNNHITNDKISEFPAKSQNYTFGLMHAQEKMNNSHDVYAPFELSEVKDLNYDYFALGHIHLRQTLSKEPLIVYSGNIQGRHINELGEKGCYLGEIDEQTFKTKLTFQQTAPITWQAKELEIKSPLSTSQLSHLFKQINVQATTYLSLRLIGAEFLTAEQLELVQDPDFWQSIAQDLPFDSKIVDLRLAESKILQLDQKDQAAFDQAKDELFNKQSLTLLAKTWAKKDQAGQEALADDDFLGEVKNLAEVKLASKLKGEQDAPD